MMNVNLSAIKQLTVHEQRGPRPLRDWFLLLLFAGALLAAISFWQWWFFKQVIAGGFVDTNAVRQAQERARVETPEAKLESWYEKRKGEEQKYATERYPYQDPSQ